MMHEREKSDPTVVAVKPVNNAERSAAEPVEPRAGAKGNAEQHSTCRAQYRVSVSQALERIRQVRRHSPEVGAVCGKAARTDLCGGRSAMSVPTAIAALAMTRSSRRTLALAAQCARGVDESSAQRGRGECRMPVAPAASCALGSGRTHTSTTIRGEISPGCCYADPDNVDWSHWMPSHQPLLTASSLRKTRKHRATFRIQTARQ